MDYHPYLECSGVGTCNRVKGKCECLDGYGGENCAKINCVNNCNGRGECVAEKVVPQGEFGNTVDEKIYYYCKCSPGYDGIDCGEKICPKVKGADNIYLTCGGNGSCDRSSGECHCNDGYSGYDCSIKK